MAKRGVVVEDPNRERFLPIPYGQAREAIPAALVRMREEGLVGMIGHHSGDEEPMNRLARAYLLLPSDNFLAGVPKEDLEEVSEAVPSSIALRTLPAVFARVEAGKIARLTHRGEVAAYLMNHQTFSGFFNATPFKET